MALKTTTVWYNLGFSHFTRNFRLSWKPQTQCLAPYSAFFLFGLLKHHSPSGHEEWGMRSWCEFQFVLTCPSWCSLPQFTPISSPQLLHGWQQPPAPHMHMGAFHWPYQFPPHVCVLNSLRNPLHITPSDSVSSVELGLSHPDSAFSFTTLFSTKESKCPLNLLSLSHMFPLHFSSLSLSLPVVPCLIVQSPSSNSLLTWSSKLPF